MRKCTIKYENPFELHMSSREEVLKAVRSVKSNGYTSVGKLSTLKNDKMIQYESQMEEDFATILEFNIGVDRFVDQPVKIGFKLGGKKRSYTPDFLAYYRNDIEEYEKLSPHLFEVKQRKDIKRNWLKLKPKFVEAIKFCSMKGWRFKIITEKEIYTPYFYNAKSLVPYLRRVPELGLADHVLDTLNYLDTSTPSELLAVATNDFDRRMNLIPALWHLIANRMIGCDLESKLTMESEIWFIRN
jgi:hypothetical protein